MDQQSNMNRAVLGVALATVLVLLVPLVASQFTDEVAWSAADSIIMGVLIFGTGLSYIMLSRYSSNFTYRLAIGLALGTTLFMVWANLAVGLIGSGPHMGNLMYIGVVAVAIMGAFSSRFKAAGMERAMYYCALSLVLIAAIALIAKMDSYTGASMIEILGVNGFFAALYAISGLLFRNVASSQSPQKTQG